MVFEHQMRMINLITRVGWDVRVAAASAANATSATAARPLDLAQGPLREAIDELVDYMLFVNEAPLGPAGGPAIQGTSGFAERFSRAGPRDKLGRSLRQLDLVTRLMRYPCSYMIYSDAFEGLPADAKDVIHRRLADILSGVDTAPRYGHLSATDRRAILEILRDTRSGISALRDRSRADAAAAPADRARRRRDS